MKRFVAGAALLVVALAIGAQTASAQNYAVPKGVGVTVAADAYAGIDPSDVYFLQARAALGLPMIAFQARFIPDVLDAGENSIGLDAAYGLPLTNVPVSLQLQAGVGYGLDSEAITVPAGVVVGFNVPSPMLSVEPWIFPQVRYVRVDVLGTTSSNTDFGVTAGLSVGLPGGIGGHVALDYDNAGESISASLGVHYRISVPGLGMVGM
ncbi:MAG: hypothetical protein PVF27_04895 [Gemmatimonadales bacterium]|jgi:hypothetical protein